MLFSSWAGSSTNKMGRAGNVEDFKLEECKSSRHVHLKKQYLRKGKCLQRPMLVTALVECYRGGFVLQFGT